VGGELGDRNIGGRAISFGLVGNVAYLPTPLIIDPGARANFDKLDFGARIAGRLTASLQVPETGLGPLFRAALDGIAVHDLQRDFYVRKFAVAPSLTFSPARNLQIQFSPSVEANAARIFGVLTDVGPSDPRARAFTYPEGATYAFAQKLSLSWDRRDNSLNASRGTFFSFGIEHVDAFPVGSSDDKGCSQDGSFCASHFIKFQTTISGYVPIYHRLRLAVEMRAGINVPLVASSKTYPDRLFFLGGAESMRAYQPNTFIPQDQADVLDPAKLPIVRGGDLLLNPHAELRIPLTTTLETVAFCDMGNLWRDPAYYPWKAAGHMAMHYAIGTGLRLMTPVFPLAFDIGINPAPRTWESRYAINFRIGLF
jgi:outer membrane protein assembly factor BamA